MELLGSTKSEMIINKIEEICIDFFLINLLVNCYIFHPKILYLFKKNDSGFSYIEVWSNDQNSIPVEMEDKINITLVIN